MDNCKLKDLWKKDEGMSFQGWDFSYLDNRWENESLPWDYKSLLKGYLKPELQLLDMGTGGGEFLLSLRHPYEKTAVTEAWDPNVKLCDKKLAPLGICVRRVYDDNHLPFEDNRFDIIINRHEAYSASEVNRVLKPNGVFVTQQVGAMNNASLSKRLIKGFTPQYPQNFLSNKLDELREASFEILYGNEYFPYLHFFDVGAVVYFAGIIEWEFPGFSVDRCFDELLSLHEELKIKPYIESTEHRYIIAARNIKQH